MMTPQEQIDISRFSRITTKVVHGKPITMEDRVWYRIHADDIIKKMMEEISQSPNVINPKEDT